LSLGRQCELLGRARSSCYYQPRPESEENLALLRRLDELYLEHPFLGSRRLAELCGVNRKRVVRLMQIAGIEALYPEPRLSRPGPGQEIHPYLLRDLVIERPNQVWSSDITDVPMRRGFLYLVAVMDWFSRYVLSWALSATLEARFCREALEAALRLGRPDIFNSDQGAQCTAPEFTATLRQHQIRISMDGRGRWLDNVFIERLWRSVKYELIYPSDFADGRQLWMALDGYFRFYNHSRPHQALACRTPAEVYGLSAALMAQA
jgi:putative transposase